MFRKQDTHIHLVGIGGMGMCGIAEVLINLGYRVSGSDMRETEITKHLAEIGGSVTYGHKAENVGESDVVVVSSAIRGYNPEIEAARAKGIPVIQRAEMLGELMRMKYSIAVAGSHGKTTTTTMIATVLLGAGMDPTAVIGGRVNSLGLANARLGKGEYLVAEADESDGSFLKLPPTVAVVTNIDAEHLDHYGTHDNVKKAFVDFVNRVPFYGLAVLCMDYSHVQSILPQVHKRFVTYGEAPQADYRARDIRFEGMKTSYVAWRRAEELGRITIGMPGRHNVLNSLATLAVCDFLGMPFEKIRDSFSSFTGVQRRFTVRGEAKGVIVVDDFGHHPMEVRATLQGARAGFSDRRVVVAFQPHRFSRTRDHLEDFSQSFNDADKVVLCDVFAAGETPIPGVDSQTLCQQIRTHGHKDVTYVARRADLAKHLAEVCQPNDIVIALGAGDIQLTCGELLTELGAGAEATRERRARRARRGCTVARGGCQPRERVTTSAQREALTAVAGKLRFAEPMSRHTTLRLGGPADVWCEPESVDELVRTLRVAAELGLPATTVGSGSNLLVRDGGIRGVVVCSRALRQLERVGEAGVRVQAGVSTGRLLHAATTWELGGVEFLGGVPGSVGGGLIMNAGTYLGEFTSVVTKVVSLKLADGSTVEREHAACGFRYRASDLPPDEIVVEGHLSLKPRAKAEIEADVRSLRDNRKAREPAGVANSGSTFKNPPGMFAGKLIEECGLKGRAVGGAQVSPKHANWLVNTGEATATQLLELIEIVREEVAKKHGVRLELEVKVLGEEA